MMLTNATSLPLYVSSPPIQAQTLKTQDGASHSSEKISKQDKGYLTFLEESELRNIVTGYRLIRIEIISKVPNYLHVLNALLFHSI